MNIDYIKTTYNDKRELVSKVTRPKTLLQKEAGIKFGNNIAVILDWLNEKDTLIAAEIAEYFNVTKDMARKMMRFIEKNKLANVEVKVINSRYTKVMNKKDKNNNEN